jgi:hypothetical protein
MEKEMMKEILAFIREHDLSLFHSAKSTVPISGESIFRTRDAKLVHQRVLTLLASHFYFPDTKNIFACFPFTSDFEQIKKRQEFFKNIPENFARSFLQELQTPKASWKPLYDAIVATENEPTFMQLQNLGIPVKYVNTRYDIAELEDYDLVQVIDCENYSSFLEQLPQSIFLSSIDDAYLERYVELLSSWRKNIELLKSSELPEEIQNIVYQLSQLSSLFHEPLNDAISYEGLQSALDIMNARVSQELQRLTLSGSSVVELLHKQKLPTAFESIVKKAIKESELPEHLFTMTIPITLDEEEIDKLLKEQHTTRYVQTADNLQKNADSLRKIPEQLSLLSDYLLYFDFISGIAEFLMHEEHTFPESSENIYLHTGKNIFLECGQPISFNLGEQHRCSILTGANSGGKTTLLEHVLQVISLFQLGLPIQGNAKMPLFTDIYYFAKSKGSMSKGAFETLLTQMARIKVGRKTLILADEIEAVTEPGIAGEIVAATAEYFLQQGCFLIIATHLGKEIQQIIPVGARIDGIEAKGLDENFNLIVDHNPVLGKLANSTPELIVERMANTEKNQYFSYLYERLKR